MKEIEFSGWLFELPSVKQHSQFSPTGSSFLHCLGLPLKSHHIFHIFGIPSSSRHEKCCQCFWLFQYSKNSQCSALSTSLWFTDAAQQLECQMALQYSQSHMPHMNQDVLHVNPPYPQITSTWYDRQYETFFVTQICKKC